MAEDVERTEQPTPRRRQEARREGQIALSQELGIAVNLLAALLALSWADRGLAAHAQRSFAELWAPRDDLTVSSAAQLLLHAFAAAGPVLLPVLLAVMFAGLAAGLAQTRFALTPARLRPRLSKLSPAQNLARVFKQDGPLELAKSLLKLAIAALAVAWALRDRLDELAGLYALPPFLIMRFQLELLLRALLAGTCALLLLALLDYAWQYFRVEKRLRMTRGEVKDELKQTQGDPQVRGRLLGLMFDRSLRRMMKRVPEADVIVTNPEHISVALLYRRTEMAAPTVIAKGAGFVALRIRELARAAGVPIVENRPLARALFRGVKVGRSVPERLFQAVAEVLAYVYRLERRRSERW
jgi:flagellar biosynthetic protein FlhB